jgi:predicted nucleic acid-binding protein
MTERFSLDANILFYVVDSKAVRKHEIAALIATRAVGGNCILALQAITEFFAAVTRKRAMPYAEAASTAQHWMEVFPTVAHTDATVQAALELAGKGRLAIWDATLLTCLEANECRYLLTEDMQDGAKVGRMKIVNPFTTALPESLAFLLGDD